MSLLLAIVSFIAILYILCLVAAVVVSMDRYTKDDDFLQGSHRPEEDKPTKVQSSINTR